MIISKETLFSHLETIAYSCSLFTKKNVVFIPINFWLMSLVDKRESLK